MAKQLTGPIGIKVSELIKLIPSSLHQFLITVYDADKWVQKLKSEVLFQLVLYSIFASERMSLRQMSRQSETPWFQAMARITLGDFAHTTIRARLMKVPAGYFKDLYTHLYDKLKENYSERQLKKYHLKRYDSTMVSVSAHLLEGMKVGPGSGKKRKVKYTTELRDEWLLEAKCFTDQAHLSEETALGEMIQLADHSSEEIIVFDRGLKSRATWAELDTESVQFITRLSKKPYYKLVSSSKTLPKDTGTLHFVQDSIVYFRNKTRKIVKHPFRMIEARRKEDDMPIFFLTNMKELPAEEIAQIYQMRWDIEVLFRFLKQEMNLSHLISSDPNAIEVMLYMFLIAAMLVLVYKKRNQIKSYKDAKIRFFNELQATILFEILDQPGGNQWLKERTSKFINR